VRTLRKHRRDACATDLLVPKLHLGTKMVAKLSLAGKCVAKCNLGTKCIGMLGGIEEF